MMTLSSGFQVNASWSVVITLFAHARLHGQYLWCREFLIIQHSAVNSHCYAMYAVSLLLYFQLFPSLLFRACLTLGIISLIYPPAPVEFYCWTLDVVDHVLEDKPQSKLQFGKIYLVEECNFTTAVLIDDNFCCMETKRKVIYWTSLIHEIWPKRWKGNQVLTRVEEHEKYSTGQTKYLFDYQPLSGLPRRRYLGRKQSNCAVAILNILAEPSKLFQWSPGVVSSGFKSLLDFS